jgi:hypothetical protein
VFIAAVVPITLFYSAHAQKLPDSIRGYKVHQVKASVIGPASPKGQSADADISINLRAPDAVEITLSGAVFEVDAEFIAGRSGKVDMITFHDFKAGGIPFKIDDITAPFSFKKNKAAVIPGPARVSVSLTDIPRAVYKQVSDDPAEISVTGTAFVVGRFKKFGMTFKRVIPIHIDIKIKNPLHDR